MKIEEAESQGNAGKGGCAKENQAEVHYLKNVVESSKNELDLKRAKLLEIESEKEQLKTD